MYGKPIYDNLQDAFQCEHPVKDEYGNIKICGRWCKDLVRHITRFHKITSREYKKMLGLDMNESLMSEDTKSKLRNAVKMYGTDRNLLLGEPYILKKGKSTIQKYKRSEQTKQRLRGLKKESKIKNKNKI
jgi:hypothetical protein